MTDQLPDPEPCECGSGEPCQVCALLADAPAE